MRTTFDLEHFNEVIDRVTNRHWADYRSDDVNTVQQRLMGLCGLLGDFLTEVARGDSVTGRAPADHGIVYVVLNQTRWDGHRRFAAWLNADYVPKQTKDRAGLLLPLSSEELSAEGANVVITGADGDTEPLRRLWIRNWEEYRQLTEELRQQRLTTWNQMLLSDSSTPRNLGIMWQPLDVESTTMQKIYCHLNPESFVNCGLPNPFALDTRLQPNCLGLVTCPGQTCPLHDLEQRLETLKPHNLRRTDGSGSPWHSVAACISYHLLRSYSIWGGSSFLSIPIMHRSSHPGGISVVSIGSLKPLSLNDITLWTKLGSKLLAPIQGDETFSALCAGATFDELPPSRCRELTHKSLENGVTLDKKLWQAYHHADKVFKDTGFLNQLDLLSVIIPRIGEVSPCVLLRNEFGLDRSEPLNKLAIRATEMSSRVGEIRARLKGHVDEQVYVMLDLAEQRVKALKRQLASRPEIEIEQRADDPSEQIPDEHFPRYDLVPLFPDGAWEDRLFQKPDWLKEKAADYRFYLSPSDFNNYLTAVFDGLYHHVDECMTEPKKIPLSVIVDYRFRANGEFLVWLLVCNGVSHTVDISRDRNTGGTIDELKQSARPLEAFCCFDAYYQLGSVCGFLGEPRIHYASKAGQHDSAAREAMEEAVALGLAHRQQTKSESRLFINGIAFPVFPHGVES